ncbi:hypothetical protein FSARC_11381 [Fusarium sarcochroum]|uniref:Uncharacterized protein n=1 Tax=Fusarium sarcochroum TaxID=1208366 RepID=A0A8H4TFX8_9HYPO|nr:hypothetical protein FSARC_11381 [Fusarium sarcochroum]
MDPRMSKSQSTKHSVDPVSIEWILKPKQAREGMFEERDDLREMVLKYREEPLTAASSLTEGRRKQTDNMWEQWEKYALGSGCDAEQVWVDVCMGRDETSTPHFRAFLSEYVKRSVTYRPCLDAREWYEVQTIKQASTIQDVWATLVKAADLKVISPRRKSDPLDGRWSLDYSSQKRGSRNTTICEVGKWISTEAKSMNLSLEQSFEKVETTTEDLLLLLHTLWNRAADIICSAEHRVAFHSAVILLGVGGWRSKSILDMIYEDVEIARVRDPKNPGKPALVATITIHHVKQRANVARRDQRNNLLLCKAFADNAFFGGYRTLEDLLPHDYQFASTAGKLDGQLTSALRNYILSHSSGVYEASYHPVHLRENLMRISFGALAGEKDQLLTQMRRTSLKRDPRAPIYITSKDFESFEKRRDLTALRKLPSNDVVKAKIKYIRDSLEKLLIDRRRQEYFDNIDKGKPVEDFVNAHSRDPRQRLHKGISAIARQISPFFEDEMSNAELIQNLTGFLDGTRIVDKLRLDQSRPLDDQEKVTDKPAPCCLPFLCPECERQGTTFQIAGGDDSWISHVKKCHGGDWNVYGAVIIGSDGQKAQSLSKRKLEDEVAPRKRVRTPEPESGLDGNWTAQRAEEHGEEEFWVTGYDGDYDEAVAYRGVY